LSRNKLFWTAFAVLAFVLGVVQFIPPPPLAVPVNLPAEQRDAHRRLNFEGVNNLRDLGGYRTQDGRQVQWGKLYRSANFAQATHFDLENLAQLRLSSLVDLRSAAEKEEEPNRLPESPPFAVIEIPILDEGNRALFEEVSARVESGDFEGFDPDQVMIEANRQFASHFTGEFSQLMHTVLEADGAPVLWHCTAGKDRTGLAAAVLLRILGVPQETVVEDYMASLEPALASRRNQMLMLRLFKGKEAAEKIEVMLGVREAWLQAAFEQIDITWGSFDNYVREGLKLDEADVKRLRDNLLQAAG
jgi:protein-tyrosine phosphatase